MDIRKKVFTERVARDWKRMLREMVESPSVEVLENINMILRDMIYLPWWSLVDCWT